MTVYELEALEKELRKSMISRSIIDGKLGLGLGLFLQRTCGERNLIFIITFRDRMCLLTLGYIMKVKAVWAKL